MIHKLVGQTLAGRYHILEASGHGSSGSLYKALDTRHKRIVALKACPHEAAVAVGAGRGRRISTERLLHLLHPHLVQLLDHGVVDDVEYLVLEDIEGQTLARLLWTGRPLDVVYAVTLVCQAAAALGYLHAQQLVHAHVSPSSMLIAHHGGVVLANLEQIVALNQGALDHGEAASGDRIYMSPEQAAGQGLDARSNIYSLGVILYELLAGQPPFGGSALPESVVGRQAPPALRQFNPVVPSSLELVIWAALSAAPGWRPQTSDEFVASLREASQSLTMGEGLHFADLETQAPPVVTTTLRNDTNKVATRITLPGRSGTDGAAPAVGTAPLGTPVAWVVAISGDLSGRQFQLYDRVTIGRGTDCDIVINSAFVSRRHASIRQEEGRFSVYDERARNGIFVNGTRVERQVLRDRDKIQIGDTTLRFVQAISPEDATSEVRQRLRDFEAIWELLTRAARRNDLEQLQAATERLVVGLLREAIGYRVEATVPNFRGIVGAMVEAPMLWIRHARFPIFVIAYDPRRSDVLSDVVQLFGIARATEYFALLVVVPTHEDTGTEAEDLRRKVSNSVFRYDIVVLDRHHLASIIAQGSSHRLVEIIVEQGIELASLSPYIVKGPVPERMFFGREQEIKLISQTIQNRNYALVAGRRMGKSSTLQRLKHMLESDPRYRAIYINCEDKFTHADVLDGLNDEFELQVDSGNPLNFRKLVTTIKQQSSPRQIVFLIDEVDQILAFDAQAQPAGQLFKTLRAVAHEGLCRFVFSGSKTLHQHLHDPQSPFFNFCTDITLKPLQEKSVTEIVRKPMHQLGIDLPDEEALIDGVIALTSCHPNLVQWVCDRLVTTITLRRVTLADLDAVAVDPVFREHFVQTAWGESTPLEKLISLVMRGPSFTLEQLSTALAAYGITNRAAMREGLDVLQLYAVLERQGQSYRFALAHFPQIVGSIEPVATQIEALLPHARAEG